MIEKNKKVEAYVNHHPVRWQKKLMLELAQILRSFHPDIQECFSYQIPMYKYGGMMCYIHATKDAVNLGFTYATELDDPFGVFQTGNQVTVRHVRCYKDDSWPKDAILYLLKAAMDYNDIRFKHRLKSKK